MVMISSTVLKGPYLIVFVPGVSPQQLSIGMKPRWEQQKLTRSWPECLFPDAAFSYDDHLVPRSQSLT